MIWSAKKFLIINVIKFNTIKKACGEGATYTDELCCNALDLCAIEEKKKAALFLLILNSFRFGLCFPSSYTHTHTHHPLHSRKQNADKSRTQHNIGPRIKSEIK